MRKIKTVNITTLSSGNVQLSEAQASPRLHNLKHINGDIYEIANPIQFKAGEELGYDGEINKTLMLDLEPAIQKEPENLLYPENEALELIKEALTIAEVDEIIEGDTRKKVLKAAEKRKKALAEELENEAME